MDTVLIKASLARMAARARSVEGAETPPYPLPIYNIYIYIYIWESITIS